MTSAIGAYTFIRMSQFPPSPREQVVLETRAGVPGVAAWKTGTRGTQFTIETLRDVASLSAASTLIQQYQTLIGTNPTTIYYGGILLPFHVLVLDVEPADVRSILLGVGGVSGTSYALCGARWSLISIPVA